MARTQLFISYANVDNRWRLRVVSHLGVLARAKLIDIWDDRKLDAGDDWFDRINDAMSRARIALLMISAPFLTSDFIQKKEIPKLFRRHEADGMTIYPLLIRSCSWEQVRWLRRMQIRPENARPVSDFRGNKIDAVLTEVAREIAKMAKRASRKARKGGPKKSPKARSPKRTRSRTAKKPGLGSPSTDYERVARHINNYLAAKNSRWVGFESIRRYINPAYTNELLFEMIDRFPDKFRRVQLKGDRPGLGPV